VSLPAAGRLGDGREAIGPLTPEGAMRAIPLFTISTAGLAITACATAGGRAAPAPGAYADVDGLHLYYEIHGLAPGTPFTTQLVVKKADNPAAFRKLFGGSSAISLKFADQSQTPDVTIQRTVNLERLKPGQFSDIAVNVA
jgi:hypothetical protein